VNRLLGIVAFALVATTTLVACGGNKESPAEAKQNLCASLDDFAASVVALQAVLAPSSSQDQITSALDDVNKAWEQVVADAKDVKSVNTDNIKSTYDDLKQSVQNRPTDQPMTAVIAGLEPKLSAFAQAWKQFAGSLDCKTTS
jgi:hypothetical protein